MKELVRIIKKLLIIVFILGVFGIGASYFFYQAMIVDSPNIHFWSLSTTYTSQVIKNQTYNTMIVSCKNKTYIWNIKSAIINKDTIYFLYYYPFNVFKIENGHSIFEYKPEVPVKEDENYYSQAPFYLIYNKVSNEITYLSAKKEVLKWNNDFNKNILQGLSKSNLVNIWTNTRFETLLNNIGDASNKYVQLNKRFNDYLNLQINK